MTLTAVLFAGGSSSRMGTDKALLEISRQPLWARQLSLLRQLQPESLWVSARFRPTWCPPEIKVILDQPPSQGPLSGVAAVLHGLTTSHLLALAIDLPQMTAEPVGKLWALAQPGCGVVPVNAGRFEPLCAIFPRESSPLAQAALGSGDLSLQHFIATLHRNHLIQAYPLTPAEEPFFLNMNTPADLQRFESESFQ